MPAGPPVEKRNRTTPQHPTHQLKKIERKASRNSQDMAHPLPQRPHRSIPTTHAVGLYIRARYSRFEILKSIEREKGKNRKHHLYGEVDIKPSSQKGDLSNECKKTDRNMTSNSNPTNPTRQNHEHPTPFPPAPANKCPIMQAGKAYTRDTPPAAGCHSPDSAGDTRRDSPRPQPAGGCTPR